MFLRAISVVLSIFLALATATAADIFAEVTLRRGEVHSGRILEWTPETLKLLGDELRSIPPTDISAIDFPVQPLRFMAGSYVVQGHGDRYAVVSPRISNELFTATWASAPLRTRLSLPLETVSGVLFDVPPARNVLYDLLAKLSRSPSGQDSVRFLTGDDLAGELVGIDGGLIEFEGSLGGTKLDQRRLRALSLDPDLAVIPDLPAARWVAVFRDGSRCTARQLLPRDDFTLQVVPLTGEPFVIPWYDVARLNRFDATLIPLSERVPTAVVYTPFLQGEPSLEGNTNIRRQPLSVRGREYVSGIGMTSRMAATYEIEPEDEAFRALVGLDDLALDMGSVTFHIDVDGQNVWSSPVVNGRSASLPTPVIDLQGKQRFTLRVDFGESGDVADIADWCDASILRSTKVK